MGGSEADILGVGDTFHSRYEVVRQIGAGGMGAVYEVLDLNTKRHRALKVMLPRLVEEQQLRRRFRAEATVAAAIDSEHIAEVLDAGIDDDTNAPFIVLELLKGSELADLVKERGPMTAEEAVFYLTQVAGALDRAHAAGVVHRDLKPENLFVTYRDDGTPRIKILDFGIAKVVTSTLNKTHTTGLLGTPAYMATEQVDGDLPISGRTDGYAVGHIAYSLLVGEPYWAEELSTARSLLHLISRIVKGPKERASARALRRKKLELPADFDAWFQQATASNPDDRFETVGASIQALAAACGVSRVSWSPEMRRGSAPPEAPPATDVPASTTVTIGGRGGNVGGADSAEHTTASPGSGLDDADASSASEESAESEQAVPSTSVSPGLSVARATTGASTGGPVSSTLDPTSSQLPKRSRWPLAMGLAALATLGVGGAAIALGWGEPQPAKADAKEHGETSAADDADLGMPPAVSSTSTIPTGSSASPPPSATDGSAKPDGSGDPAGEEAPAPRSALQKPVVTKPASPRPAAPRPASPRPASPRPAAPRPKPGDIDLIVPTR